MMRPSKKDDLVDGALAIFEAQGFHATGVDAVAAHCAMSKTSIYNHFQGKTALILATLDRRDEQFRAWLANRTAELSPKAEGRPLALFDALGEWFASEGFRGCAFIKAGAEFQAGDDPVRARASEHKQALLGDLAGIAKAAGLKKPKALARRLLLLIEGAIVGAHLGHQKDPAKEAKAIAEGLIAASVK